MQLASTLSLYAGGPGSGCNPDAGVCGRPAGTGKGDDPRETVAKKFGRYEKMVDAVANRKINGLAVFGERGLGKSKTVIDSLAKANADVTKIKGNITPKELFNTLSQHRGVNDIVWFDDADSAFKDTNSLNMLKAALDSDEPREVSWLSSKKDEGEEQTFRFQGRIIVTTNIELSTNEHVAALVDRMHWINLKLTPEEKMARIEDKGPKMLKEMGVDDKTSKQVLDWIKTNKDDIGTNMSMRTVRKVGELTTFDDDWKESAKSLIEETNKLTPGGGKEAKYTPPGATPAESPSRTKDTGEGRPKLVVGKDVPKKYATIAHSNGFHHSGGNTYTNDKGHKITINDREWRITPAKGGGREKKGTGAPDFRDAIKVFASAARPIDINCALLRHRWSSVHPAYV